MIVSYHASYHRNSIVRFESHTLWICLVIKAFSGGLVAPSPGAGARYGSFIVLTSSGCQYVFSILVCSVAGRYCFKLTSYDTSVLNLVLSMTISKISLWTTASSRCSVRCRWLIFLVQPKDGYQRSFDSLSTSPPRKFSVLLPPVPECRPRVADEKLLTC